MFKKYFFNAFNNIIYLLISYVLFQIHRIYSLKVNNKIKLKEEISKFVAI